jgi:hypothetical protein
VDYLDSGHIRLGELQSLSIALNPIEFEILDYRVGSEVGPMTQNNDFYEQFLGTYSGKEEIHVMVQNGRLAVNIPGKIILALRDPDEKGFWYTTVSPNVYVEFRQNDQGTAQELILHEIVPFPKKTEENEADGVPPYMACCLGIYELQQANAEFRVFYRNGSLFIHNPMENRDIRLQKPDDRGRWKDEFNKNEIFFEKDAGGRVVMMKIDSINRFRKEG